MTSKSEPKKIAPTIKHDKHCRGFDIQIEKKVEIGERHRRIYRTVKNMFCHSCGQFLGSTNLTTKK